MGNVRAVVSDRRIPEFDGSGNITGSHAEILSATDYYPFGQEMPGRTYSPNAYRYGFNGKEKDDEIKGSSGTSYDYGARMYDTRIGRMFSRDPMGDIAYPGLTPYSGMGGNPICNIDAEGKLIIYFGGYWIGKDNMPQIRNIEYWDVQLLQNAAFTYKDNNAMFFNGSSSTKQGKAEFGLRGGGGSPPIDRYNEGYAAATLYAMDIRRELDNEIEDETGPGTITSIGHSMGVEYSEGFLNALSNIKYPAGHPKEGQNIFSKSEFKFWKALAPYDAEDICIPAVIDNANAYQHPSYADPIAGSKKIPGIDNKNYNQIGIGHGNGTFGNAFDEATNNVGIRNQTPEGRGTTRGTGLPTPAPKSKYGSPSFY